MGYIVLTFAAFNSENISSRLFMPCSTHNPHRPLWKIPSQCHICHAWPADNICQDCRRAHATIQLRCAGCALLLPATSICTDERQRDPLEPFGDPPAKPPSLLCADCLRQPLAGIDGCHAAVSYAWPWQQCIDGFKFGAQTGWVDTFAELMLQSPPLAHTLRASDYVLPMPLHPLRLAERGFNQSWLLAKALRALLHRAQKLRPEQATLCHDGLLRIRHTKVQSQLPLAARLRNMHKAFAVAPQKATALAGKRVVLVDDVMTSGASVLAAAQALRHANVAQVHVVVFARTEKS